MANGKPGRSAKYPPEFKKNTADYYLASGKAQRECAEDLDVPRKSSVRWIHESEAGNAERVAVEELRALRKEVETAAHGGRVPKRAATFVANRRDFLNDRFVRRHI